MNPASAGAPALAVAGLSKSFNIPHERINTLKERVLHPLRRGGFERLEALRDVSFEVAPGEVFGIVGRNGSGKSTLLKCLAGIYRPDSGEIWLRGRMAPFIELGVGFNPDLTARDNVLINAIMLGLTPSEARERYDEVIRFAELEDFVDLKLKNYSSGMQVRLAFSVMIQVDADVLLIDEVLAVGDAAFQQKCHQTLEQMREEGRTILFITHDMSAVASFCDRALLLECGRIEALGEPRAVAQRYNELNFGHVEDAAGPSRRRGDGSAAVVGAWFEDEHGGRVDVLEHGRVYSFHQLVEARVPIVDPIFGFMLFDQHGRNVFGANTTTSYREPTGSLAPGERMRFSVRFDNLLASGRYSASAAVAHPGAGDRLMDIAEDCATVRVSGPRTLAGLVELPHEASVTRYDRVPEGAVLGLRGGK